jgi:hypothetical protein
LDERAAAADHGPELIIASNARADDRSGWRIRSFQVVSRLAFSFGAPAVLLVLRSIDPVAVGNWLPFHTSCGAVTGVPCIFCGMTRALHLLLNGHVHHALYFNWLAIPFLGAVISLILLFSIEIWQRRTIPKVRFVLRLTKQRLAIIGLTAVLLWAFQVYLALSQHKQELLNPDGPLYTLFLH